MRGGSGATAPASSGGAATAKGNIEKQVLSFLSCNNINIINKDKKPWF